MAPPMSDAVVVDVLRKVDRLIAPLVRRLGRPPVLPQDERDRWWADGLPHVAAGVSAAPRFAGKLADLLPLQNTVGSAVQALVVGGVATEHGVTDPAERVSLLARVLLARDLPPDRVEPLLRRGRGGYPGGGPRPRGGCGGGPGRPPPPWRGGPPRGRRRPRPRAPPRGA